MNPEGQLAIQARMRKHPQPTRKRPEHCECCGGPPNGSGHLHLDHCHESGVFRGWLCASCNLGIGNLGDDLDGVEKAASYLRRAREQGVQ